MSNTQSIMLVYEHKANGRKIVPNGISFMDEYDRVMALSAHTDCIMTTKAIKPGSTSIDIYEADLQTEETKKSWTPKKNECPWKVFLGYEFVGHKFNQLTIITPVLVALGGREESKKEKEGGA